MDTAVILQSVPIPVRGASVAASGGQQSTVNISPSGEPSGRVTLVAYVEGEEREEKGGWGGGGGGGDTELDRVVDRKVVIRRREAFNITQSVVRRVVSHSLSTLLIRLSTS